ncbi:MAG: RNA polymerase sigma factor, partial [Kiritimatiellae bacterium]|nr:RNA polymerase sigma factor [Kiritimatiellia bacterium]
MDIVEEIRNDREKGAKRLESEYRSGLMTLAMRICHNSSDAAELVNHTFAEVIANIDKYAEQSAFFGWMSKILVNLHAKEKRRKSVDDIVYPGEVPEIADAEAQEEIYRNLDHSLLRDAIETLPEDIRKTLLLHYFMDMPVKDIARFLAIPSGTVMWRLHYARQMLAAKMGAATEKPGGKAVLLALLLCGITALGAAVWHLAVPGEAQNPATATNADHATSDMRQADAYGLQFSTSSNLPQSPSGVAGSPQRGADASNLSTFQPFNFSTDNSQGENMNITKSTRAAAMLAAATIATSAAATDTYTWTGTANSLWDTTSQNWTVGGTPASWVDGNDAVFNLPASATITVDGQRAVHDMSIVSANSPTFSGTGSLEVSGIVSNLSQGASFSVPLVGANPLRLAGQSEWSLTLNAVNTYSGGTYVHGLDNGTSGGITLQLKKGDSSLGTPPATPSDNIFANDLGTIFLYDGSPWTLNANRRIVIGNGYRFTLGSSSTLTVNGEIRGVAAGGLDYPTNTHFLVKQNWNGLVKLDPGAGHTNDVGTLDVRGRLRIESGVTRVAIGLDNTKNMGVRHDNMAIGNRNGGNALVYVCGGGPWGSKRIGDYDYRYGQLAVNGGQIATPEDQWNIQSESDINKVFQAIDYANVSVTNGSIVLPNAKYLNGDAVNSCDTPARLSIGEGGEVNVGKIVVAGSSLASEINLGAGGVLKTAQFTMTAANPGAINLDGGAIYPVSVGGIAESNFLGPYYGGANWANVTLNVMAGGALFTPTNMPAFCNLPLKSGVASGGIDGGLTVRGTREFVLHASGSDYSGPTTVEGGSLMQVRT